MALDLYIQENVYLPSKALERRSATSSYLSLSSFKTIANIIIVDAQGLVQFLGLKLTLMLFF